MSNGITSVIQGPINGKIPILGTTFNPILGVLNFAFASINSGDDDVETGGVVYFPFANAPNGYLKANGAIISRTTYSALFAKIGTVFGAGNGTSTFQLLDLRGIFIRGWDDGKGIDIARVLGSLQLDDLKSHAHLGASNLTQRAFASGNFGHPSGGLQGATDAPGILTALTGGTETRPRNMALTPCIKF